jgi:hypothetical protein
MDWGTRHRPPGGSEDYRPDVSPAPPPIITLVCMTRQAKTILKRGEVIQRTGIPQIIPGAHMTASFITK